VFLPGVKRPGSGVDQTSPHSTEVKERVELFLSFPSGPSWPVIGEIFLYRLDRTMDDDMFYQQMFLCADNRPEKGYNN